MRHRPWFVLFVALALTVEARGQQTKDAPPKAPPPKAAAPQLPPNVELEADVEYGRAGDRALKLDIIKPKDQGDKVLPVFVYIHGGGWRGGNKEGGRGLAAVMAATGNYVGVSVGYRLVPEAIWPAQIYDCKAAIRWLRANAEKLHIDPKHIGVMGHSAGGHLVALLGTSGDVSDLEGDCGNVGYSSRVQCVADMCGPSDFPHFIEQEGNGGKSAVAGLFGGPPAEHAEAAKAASPITYVSSDDPPFLIVHGTKDNIVPFEQSTSLASALKKVGVYTVLVPMVDAGHGFGGGELNNRVAAFFELYLREKAVKVSDEPIPAPAPKPVEKPKSAEPEKK